MRRVPSSFLGAVALLAPVAGCNSILDFGKFAIDADAGREDAASSDAGPASCLADDAGAAADGGCKACTSNADCTGAQRCDAGRCE